MPLYLTPPLAPALDDVAAMFADEFTLISMSSDGFYAGETFNYIRLLNGGAPNTASATRAFSVKGGTYSLIVWGATGTDEPILAWDIDGVAVVTGQDWYSTPHAAAMQTSTGIVIAAGDHTLRMRITTKNALSVGYTMYLTRVVLIRTGA